MLDFNYYFIDVGQNYCLISYRNHLVSLKEALVNRNQVELKLARETIAKNLKNKYLFGDSSKMVMVNKRDKIFVESYVEDEQTRVRYEPIISCESCDVYIVKPGQGVMVTCQVVEREVENRYITYDALKPATKRNTKRW